MNIFDHLNLFSPVNSFRSHLFLCMPAGLHDLTGLWVWSDIIHHNNHSSDLTPCWTDHHSYPGTGRCCHRSNYGKCLSGERLTQTARYMQDICAHEERICKSFPFHKNVAQRHPPPIFNDHLSTSWQGCPPPPHAHTRACAHA